MTDSTPTSRGPSRGFFGYGLDALAGVLSAFILGYAVSHAGSVLVLLAYLATIPLFLAGLGAGFISGFIACVCGVIGLFATAPTEVALFYVLIYAVPSLVLIFIATRRNHNQLSSNQWSSEGTILSALVVYPCILFLAIYAATLHYEGGLLKMTQDAFEAVSDQAVKALGENGENVTPEMTVKLHQYLGTLARIAPALGMCGWFFSTFIAMVASQGLLCQQKWNLRPAFALSELRAPVWLFVLALLSLAGTFAPTPYDYIGLNLSLVLCVPFFLTGLAVVHAFAASTRYSTAILIFFYLVISLVLYLVPLVALLGAVDEIADFRKRLTEKTVSKNN